MPRLPLPPPRRLPWPLKPLSSAGTALRYDARGRMVMTIAHDRLAGLTPEMLAWWFRNIGGGMEVDGQVLDRYLVWHPFDHILWELANRLPGDAVGVGSRFHIVEAFGANPQCQVDVVETVVRLDASGITLIGRMGGIEVTRLDHDFIATEGGALYRSTLRVGVGLALLGPMLNPLVHRLVFPEAMGRAWLKHNVEEVGLLEHIVPRIYPADGAAERDIDAVAALDRRAADARRE